MPVRCSPERIAEIRAWATAISHVAPGYDNHGDADEALALLDHIDAIEAELKEQWEWRRYTRAAADQELAEAKAELARMNTWACNARGHIVDIEAELSALRIERDFLKAGQAQELAEAKAEIARLRSACELGLELSDLIVDANVFREALGLPRDTRNDKKADDK